MTAPALSPLAVSAAPLLRALAQGGHATLSALAAACGRDVRHLNRDIARLCAEGLVAAPDGVATKDAVVTDAGFAALAALARAEGPDAPDGVWLAAHQLLPDEGQPRKRTGLDEDAIDQLAASILERHAQGLPGLITPPTVRWVGDDDHPGLVEWVIVSGERRWRAWTAALRLRTALADPLPTDTRFFCPIFRGTAAQAAVHAAVENLQRSDLDDLEWADHFAAMVDADPSLNGARIAALLGKPGPSGERWVQERLRVARTATPQARARFVESRRRALAGEPDPEPFTWTHLRDSVKVAAPKAQPHIARLRDDPALRLLVLEMALRSANSNGGLWDAPQPVDGDTARADPAFTAAVMHGLAVVTGDAPRISASLTTRAMEWIAGLGVETVHELRALALAHARVVEGAAFDASMGRGWSSIPLRCGGWPEPRSDRQAATPDTASPALLDEDGAVLAAGSAAPGGDIAFLDDDMDDAEDPLPAAPPPATAPTPPPATIPPLRQATIALHRAAAAQADLVARWLGADPPAYAAMHDAHAALVRALDDLRPYVPAPPDPG